ncbi:MAG: lipopolysaccharide transport system ATP-binding protein [Polaribacter sp.]|jgi:lipopolysaccharide transport system ATP-binding protein
MNDVILKIENLSKQYRLGAVSTGTISHDLNRFWAKICGKEDPYLKIGETNNRASKGTSEYVWALKDINFEVKRGEVLGIIGKNGAGKSTLLKILSKVTGPTTGAIKSKGRIASLLEVGTGFHREMTGKENIFLNGAILGMTKKEIANKLDEIVEFSGCERYIDTPVKRYSSGMKVRLAFAVAAHLEPDILIVDEVLAVGDAEFQKKAIGKMQDISGKGGRTVLFVSHNMAAVKSLCTRCVVLVNGAIVFYGSPQESVLEYQKNINLLTQYEVDDLKNAVGNTKIKIKSFGVKSLLSTNISISSGISVKLLFYNIINNINLDVTFELLTDEELVVFKTGTLLTQNNNSKKGFYEVKFDIQPNLLNAGNYYFKLTFGQNQRYLLYENNGLIGFKVENESLGTNSNIFPGVIRPNFNWKINFKE